MGGVSGRSVLVLALVGLGVVLGVTYLNAGSTEQGRLEARTVGLLHALDFGAADPPAERATRLAGAVDALCAPGIVVRLGGQSGSIDGREALAQRLASELAPFATTAVALADLELASAGPRWNASAKVVLRADGPGGVVEDTRRVQGVFARVDDEWRLVSAEVSARDEAPPEARP